MRYESSRIIGGLLLASLAAVGCDKPPLAEQTAARAAVDRALAAEARVYAAAEVGRLADTLRAAESEMQRQGDRTFPNYEQSRASLAWVQAHSDDVIARARQVKDETRARTRAAVDAADTSIAAAERLLATAPRGKESDQEIGLIQGDLTQLRAMLEAAQQSLAKDRFDEAQAASTKIRTDADRIAAEVKGVIDRVEALKAKSGRRRVG